MSTEDELRAEIAQLRKEVTDFSVNATLGFMYSLNLIMEISRLGVMKDDDLIAMVERTRSQVIKTVGENVDANPMARRCLTQLASLKEVLSPPSGPGRSSD